MRRLHLLILGLILLIGLFFRTYKIVERFQFAHDGDLYSWIIKDVVVNHHLRLIGQLTSAPGIFIGPAFYYLLVPFFILFKMDPAGALVPTVILGIITIFSYYFVLSTLFNKNTGLIAAFLYAILISTSDLDRWVVPTITTSLWAIWYFYALLMTARGKFFVLPVLGILVGLIWNIHIALLPSLIAIPLALLISKKHLSLKQIVLFFIALTITSLPLILFEMRHNFQQTISLIQNFTASHEGLSGINKFSRVLEMIVQNTNALFLSPQSFKFTQNILFVILILITPMLLVKKRVISFKDLLPLYAWVMGTILFFSLSSSPISEYYFQNFNVIFIAFISLLLSFLIKRNRKFLYIIWVFLILIFLKNAYFLINQNYYNKGYLERKGVVEYIAKDANQKGFPCFGISYITAPGENVGFRYFFYLKNQHLVHPSLDVPVYNIVIPDELSLKEVKQKFGHIGIIPPTTIPPEQSIEKSCRTPDTNITDPVFGYVD